MDSLPSRTLLSFLLVVFIASVRSAAAAADNCTEARLSRRADSGEKRAARLLKILKNSARLFNCTECAIALAEIILTAYVSAKIVPLFSFSHAIAGYAAALSALAVVLLVFGVYMPRRIAAKEPEKLLIFLSPLVAAVYFIFTPAAAALGGAANLLSGLFGVNPKDTGDEVTEEEIRQMVDAGSESGAIDPEEKEMIHNIFELDDTSAESVMTHRTDVVFLWMEELDEWMGQINETNHSVYPVCGEKVDDIVGLLYSRDFLRLLIDKKEINEKNIREILRQPYFVPESIKADDLFRKMQKNKTHFAVVLDEYGGLGGIISMSDLLEEIVGSLDSEYDEPEEEIVRLDENTWKIPGGADIDTVSEALGTELPIEEYNTFAGMILGELGTIPEDGTTIELEAFGLSIRVTRIEEHRIEEALVCRTDPNAGEDSE